MNVNETVLANCQCRQYIVQPPNHSVQMIYVADSSGRTITGSEYKIEDSVRTLVSVDSFFYNSKQQIAEQRTYTFWEKETSPVFVYLYTYSESGQLVSMKRFYKHTLDHSEEYRRDEEGRPLLFISVYYLGDGRIETENKLAFTFTSNTTARFTHSSNGSLTASGTHVYNRRYQILDEVIENKVTGAKSHFIWTYSGKRRLQSISKETLVAENAGLFWSNHYLMLSDSNRKIQYAYDSRGRVLSKKLYRNLAPVQVVEYTFTYIE